MFLHNTISNISSASKEQINHRRSFILVHSMSCLFFAVFEDTQCLAPTRNIPTGLSRTGWLGSYVNNRNTVNVLFKSLIWLVLSALLVVSKKTFGFLSLNLVLLFLITKDIKMVTGARLLQSTGHKPRHHDYYWETIGTRELNLGPYLCSEVALTTTR